MEGETGAATMLALVFRGKQEIALERVPKPVLLHPTDVILRVTLCGICGSDLHSFHEREVGLAPGTVVGHEMVGVVESVGAAVTKVKVGDRMMSPFTTCCGQCFYCDRAFQNRCSHPQAHVFGWISAGLDSEAVPAAERRGLHGSQAQYVHVPLADSTLVKVPDGISDEEAVLLGDILSTAFFCAEQGGVSDGSSVLVVGCGPVGLLAVLAAQHMGAAQVIAVDAVPERLALAAQLGAEPISLISTPPPPASQQPPPAPSKDSASASTISPAAHTATPPQNAHDPQPPSSSSLSEPSPSLASLEAVATVNTSDATGDASDATAHPAAASPSTAPAATGVPAVGQGDATAAQGTGAAAVLAAVRERTGGRGVDVALEAVGAPSALRLAFDCLRPAGCLSSVGVHTYASFPFTPVEGYDKNITYLSGRCPARRYMERLAPLVAAKKWDFTRVITHRMGLSEGVRGYELFDKKLDGCVKVVLDPWR